MVTMIPFGDATSSIGLFFHVLPGMRPRFLSQKIAQKEPENKIPSTQQKATSLSAKDFVWLIHLAAHAALTATAGMLWIALNKCSFSFSSRM